MYCKYCGAQIADDSVFCSNCGRLLIDGYTQCGSNISKYENSNSRASFEHDNNWVSTQDLQWKKPLLVRIVQCVIVTIALFWGIYSITCLISGGEVDRHFGERRTHYNYSNPDDPLIQYEENLYILDYWRIFRTKSTKWNEARTQSYYRGGCYKGIYYSGGAKPWAFSYEDIQGEKVKFQLKVVFLGIVLAIIILWLTIVWIKRKPFPKERDGLPRDFADEIEEYVLYGFCKHKYVFFKKDGVYGVLDVAQYRIHTPAQYDTIAWRTHNKTFDALKDGEETTFVIEVKKEQTFWDNIKTRKIPSLVIGIIFALLAAFPIIGSLIDMIFVGNYDLNYFGILIFSFFFGFGAYLCIEDYRKKTVGD